MANFEHRVVTIAPDGKGPTVPYRIGSVAKAFTLTFTAIELPDQE